MAADKDMMTSLFVAKKASMGQRMSSLAAQVPMSGLPPSWIALVIKLKTHLTPRRDGDRPAWEERESYLFLTYVNE